MCCGGYGHHQGYTDWKHTFMGDSKKSVPDSCCLFEAPGCGQNLFEITDIRVIVQKINIHGCLFVMKKRLDTHVTTILMVFAGIWYMYNISFLVHLNDIFQVQALSWPLLSCFPLCWPAALPSHSPSRTLMMMVSAVAREGVWECPFSTT